MVHSFGKRARTRDKYSRPFRQHGIASVSRLLQVFRRGEHVDIFCDPSQQKGMPYHYYHGKTGVVFNVTQRAVGVEVKKVVGNRTMLKRIHVRIEHVRKSRCREDFLRRKKENTQLRKEAKERGEGPITIKRLPKGPKAGGFVSTEGVEVEVMETLPFVQDY
eukprot:GHVS01000406.1.p1 GENE.GHVS01000406.1~~GHVS01000406.1.p1  ORF type:complete len:162 (+),score=28.64 GHVS01000406.1:103-588(+)